MVVVINEFIGLGTQGIDGKEERSESTMGFNLASLLVLCVVRMPIEVIAERSKSMGG